MYKRIPILLGFCILTFLPLAQAQVDASSQPFNSQLLQEQKHTYPQLKLADCDANSARSQSLGSTQMRINSQGDIAIRGYDHQGRPWEASLETAPVMDCEVWQADLNGDGQNDLIFVNFGTNSSGGWDTNLSLIVFDDKGRPFPWQATGNFHVGAAGIVEIISSGGASTPHVIVNQREGDGFSGYTYRQNTLSIAGGRLSSIENKRWPTLSPAAQTAKAAEPEATQPLDPLTTADKRPADEEWPRIVSLAGDTDDDIKLRTSDGKVLIEPKIVVLDLRSGARVIHFSANKADLQKLFHDKAAVISVGTSCEQEVCQPLILWAKF